MKITAIRIRVLRSRSVGYGHDAAEIEAQLEDGDDATEVAAELRRRCEAEVTHGAEHARVLNKIGDTYATLKRLEDQAAGYEKQVKEARETLRQFEQFLEAAAEAGVHVPQPLARHSLPF